MTIARLYGQHADADSAVPVPTLSFELYPPRTLNPNSPLRGCIDRLIHSGPDWVSVTYGASGATRGPSLSLINYVRDTTGTPTLAHLTCLGAREGDLTRLTKQLMADGVRNFLALRGDTPAKAAGTFAEEALPHSPSGSQPGAEDTEDDDSPADEGAAAADALTRAVQLVRLIRAVDDHRLAATGATDRSSIAVACYPAAHGEGRKNDFLALKDKQDAGADFAITQVFYRADDYISYVAEAREVGITLPIIPGIIPLTDLGRLRRLAQLTGVQIPPDLEQQLDIADDDQRVRVALKQTFSLCQQVLDAGAPGIHLYTFNRARPALDIVDYLRAAGYRMHSGRMPGRDLGLAGAESALMEATLRQITPGA